MLKGPCSLVGVVLCWFFVSRQTHGGEPVSPRGVQPVLASFYKPGNSFKCLDGSQTISYDKVNDDYCDCQDGSDEPGTSACHNSNFYCQNKGFKPSLLFSSRVNDGICDCCDGSDEWELENRCPNTCQEMGAAEKREMERLAKLTEEGLKLKAELIEKGKELRNQRIQDLASKKMFKETALREKEAKRAVKEEAEAPEKVALDRIREEEERIAQLKKGDEKKELEKKVFGQFEKLDLDKNGELTKDEMAKEIRFDQNKDGLVSEEEVGSYLSGKESYDKNTFLETGWPLISHLFESNSTESSTEQQIDDADDDVVGGDIEDYDYDEKVESDMIKPGEVKKPQPPEAEAEAPKYTEEIQMLINRATAARTEFDQAEKVFKDLESEVDELERMVNQDFGRDQEFAMMSQECFEFLDHEYTYSLCAFDSCSQKSNNGGSETSLGLWEKWSGPDSDPYSQMSFTQGAQCWNGPHRSVKVNIKCGTTSQILSVSEPAKCEYMYNFETPAACKKNDRPPSVHDEL